MTVQVQIPKPQEVDLARLNFAAYNPRQITEQELHRLKASIQKHGFVEPVVVQKKAEDGTQLVLIGGHQRIRALRELCGEQNQKAPKKVWASVLDVPDKAAKALNVALNRIGGDFDTFKLGELLADIRDGYEQFDFDAIGFDERELDALVRAAKGDMDQVADLVEPNEDLTAFARSVTLTVEFATVEDRDRARLQLAERAKASGRKPGEVLLDALALPVKRNGKAPKTASAR